MNADKSAVADLLARYRAAAEATADPDEAASSRHAYEAHTLYKELRETEAGRAGLTALLDDPNPQVRRWAAAHTFAWARDAARAVLEALDPADG